MLRTLEGLLWTTRNLTPEFGVDCIFMHSLPSQANHDANMDSPSLQQQPTGPSYNLSLPLELCEYIIDFLWDDLDALEACALAYPVFATRADYRMDDISRANCLTNEAAMNSLSRDLFASSAYSRYFDTLKIRVEEYASWCPSVPLRLGPKLSRLNQLELIGVFTSHKTHYDTTKHFSLFRSITILRLADCTFPKFADFARFIIAFPNLSTLEINDVDWDEYLVLQHILGKSRTKKFHIKDLYIDVSIGRVDYLGQLFNWLITTPAPKTITTLSIQIRFVEDIAPITKFLKTSGEVLRQLKIYTQPGLMQRAQISGNLSVESLSSLQHIIFDGVGLQDISIFLSILSCVKPDLERIYLDMKGYDPKDLDHPNWQILEDYFSKDVFTKTFLSFSFFILGVMIGRDEDRTAEVLQRLPMLRARISFHPM